MHALIHLKQGVLATVIERVLVGIRGGAPDGPWKLDKPLADPSGREEPLAEPKPEFEAESKARKKNTRVQVMRRMSSRMDVRRLSVRGEPLAEFSGTV